MINFGIEDSIDGWKIKGVWSVDENIKNIYKCLLEKSK